MPTPWLPVAKRKAKAMTNVVGIDTSLTSTGIAALNGPVATLHRVRSSGKKKDTLVQRRARLDRIAGEIVVTTLRHAPDLVVIEGPSMNSSYGHPHDRSGLWWLVVFALQGRGLRVLEVPPTNRIKYATGKGGGAEGSKDAVLTAVVRRYFNIEVKGNDQADAVLLAAIGRRMLGDPIEEFLPAANLAALDKLSLP